MPSQIFVGRSTRYWRGSGGNAAGGVRAASMVAYPADLNNVSSFGITSDAFAATKVTLKAIQASTDAFPPLKSVVSAVIVILELSEKTKSNKKGCEHIAKRSARLVQDIWGQTKNFDVALPAEVKQSVIQIEKLVKEIKIFFEELKKREPLGTIGSPRSLHLESAAADRERHAAVLAVSRMSESERLLLTQIHGKVLFDHVGSVFDYDLGVVHMGKHAGIGFFFFDPRSGAPFALGAPAIDLWIGQTDPTTPD
ncbi:hypothetical protein B0H14DRAFT_3161235 [Mycena olivaceomarginata]|nr:hypothetical protein B0H14DRAFT_3161235 [Mycena olivaceomarginata]